MQYNELIIGREGIFDAFDIEFKQAEELMISKKNNCIAPKKQAYYHHKPRLNLLPK